jgi:peroxiredoxin
MLKNGDVFPSLTFARVGGGEIHLPADLAGGFGVVLFHRGSCWPYCNAQLAAFAGAADKFAGEGIKVVSVSVDDREKSETLVEKYKLGFPVAYGANARAVSAVTGASSMTIPCVPRQPASSSIPKAGWWRPSIRPTRSAV